MSKPTNRRWSCGNPEHKAVLGPMLMRKDDVRRFCWDCSTESGRMVERACEVAEKKREVKKKKKRTVAQRNGRIRAMLSRARKLKAWKRGPGGGTVAAMTVGRVRVELVFQPSSGRELLPFCALHVPPIMPEWRAGSLILQRLVAGAKVREDEPMLLFAAAREFWPEVEAQAVRIAATYRLGTARVTAAMVMVIETVLREINSNPAEE